MGARLALGGGYGEEYETLKVMDGRNWVTRPRRLAQGPFTEYRIDYWSPDIGGFTDGAVLLFPQEAARRTISSL